MSKDIYEQHRAAFDRVSAYVILNGDNTQAGKVAFKYPADGAGRLYCYFHIHGQQMARGHANGYGYDKASAAAHSAVQSIDEKGLSEYPETLQRIRAMKTAITDGGTSWDRELENAGFKVLTAI